MNKPRIIKDYKTLDKKIQHQIKLSHPEGYEQFLISFNSAKGKLVRALPLETEEYYYMIKMPVRRVPKKTTKTEGFNKSKTEDNPGDDSNALD